MNYLILIGLLTGLKMATAGGHDVPPVAAFYLGNGHLTVNGLDNGTPLPDGTELKIYWDWDDNGPDAKDPQPIVGDQLGEANFNKFVMNSADLGAETGQFLSDPMFNIVGAMPEPPIFYLRVCLSDRQLVSNVMTLTPGLAEYEFMKWEVDKTPCKR